MDTRGEIVREPFASTEPMFVIVTLDAFVVVQISEPAFPCVRVVGLAVRVHTGALGGGGRFVTVMVFTQLTAPPLPVAVRV